MCSRIGAASIFGMAETGIGAAAAGAAAGVVELFGWPLQPPKQTTSALSRSSLRICHPLYRLRRLQSPDARLSAACGETGARRTNRRTPQPSKRPYVERCRPGCVVCPAIAEKDAGVCRRCDPDAGARRRCQYRDFQRHQQRPAAPASVSQRGAARVHLEHERQSGARAAVAGALSGFPRRSELAVERRRHLSVRRHSHRRWTAGADRRLERILDLFRCARRPPHARRHLSRRNRRRARRRPELRVVGPPLRVGSGHHRP